jgi:hypothetical protein
VILGKIAAKHVFQAMAMNSEQANFMFVPVVSFLSTTGRWQDESDDIQSSLDNIPTKEFMPWAPHVLSHVSKFPLLRSVLTRLMEECPQSMSIKVSCENSEETEGIFKDSLAMKEMKAFSNEMKKIAVPFFRLYGLVGDCLQELNEGTPSGQVSLFIA